MELQSGHISLKALYRHPVSSSAELRWECHSGSVSSHKAGSWQRNQVLLQNDFARLSHGTAALTVSLPTFTRTVMSSFHLALGH